MKIHSDWRSVRLWESRLERELLQRFELRMHGLVRGTVILLLTWALSHLLMRLGVGSLALRYLAALGGGYLAYLMLLRWVGRLLRRNTRIDPDAVDLGLDLVRGPPGGGSADIGVSDIGVSDVAGGALDLAAGADEGAVVVLPVLAVFLICAAGLLGAGALVLLYFGAEALLAVAIELAFSYVSARVAVRLAREGWLVAAVRLTWKPLLGALVDRFLPRAHSLPVAVRMLLHR